MDLKTMRRRCAERLQALDLPAGVDIPAFCEVVARRRGRPIMVRSMVGRAGLCGLWAETAAADVIFYERETSRLHQQHIILHELSHLLCGHRPVPLAETELVRLVLPDLEPEMVRRVLGRAAYSAVEEQEAEILASLILERMQPVGPVPPADAADGLVERLEASLGSTGGELA